MGIVSPVGNRLDDAWTNVCEGNSGTVIVDDFDTDPYEWLDTDEDGTGNNADTDDDGDGFPDVLEIEAGTKKAVIRKRLLNVWRSNSVTSRISSSGQKRTVVPVPSVLSARLRTAAGSFLYSRCFSATSHRMSTRSRRTSGKK